MRGAFLSVSIENAEFLLPVAVERLAAGALAQPSQVHQICTLYRQRGLARLLLSGVAEPFHLAAMQSCSALVFGLSSWPAASQASSWANPLFDAIAAGYWDGAAALAAAMRDRWNPELEYEDDFVYIQLVIALAVRGDVALATTLAERYAEILDGPADARLDVCRALLAADAESFDDALVRLLDERDERVRELVTRGVIGDDAARWLAHVSTEGLALLAIAGRLGIETAAHYLHCPHAARAASPFIYDPGAWRVLDPRPARR